MKQSILKFAETPITMEIYNLMMVSHQQEAINAYHVFFKILSKFLIIE